MAKVSIVIPVYNVEKYLRECLDSAKNQTLKDIEIICVDDGSTDMCSDILDEYAKTDNRFVVIHKENEGYGKAVNVGMDLATAPYISILESDDYVSNDMYETLYSIMEKKKLDVIKCDYFEFYTSSKGMYSEEYKAMNENEHLMDLYEVVISARYHEDALEFAKYTWSGMYNSDYLREFDIRHNETPGASYQDNGFWFQTMLYSRRLYFLKRAFYHYRIDNPNSSMYSTAKVYAVCDEFDYINNILDTLGELGQQFYRWSYYKRIMDCVYNIWRVSDEYKLPLALKTRDDLIKGCIEGHIDCALWNDWWSKKLFVLLSDPQKIVDEEKERVNKILSNTANYDSIILYGAGLIGKRTQKALKLGRENRKIKAFAVTRMGDNEDELLGIPVMEIDKLIEYKEDALIVISVGAALRKEVEENVNRLGFKHYVYASDIL